MSTRKNEAGSSPWGKTSRFSIKNTPKTKLGFSKEDKERFFKHGVLPKFKNTHRSEKWLHKKCVPVETELMHEATTVLNKVRDQFGNDGSFIEAAYGKRISVNRASEVIHNYLIEHGVDGMLSVYFSSELECSGKMSWTGPMNKFNQPERRNFSMWVKTTNDNMYFRETGILNLSNHEIGTHFFRAINDGLQPWYANRSKFGIESFKSQALKDTEEGLASLNTAFESKVKYIWGPAMLYYTACMSLEMNFKELFDHLKIYAADPEVRWKYVVRVKRGRGPMQLGGHGKDQCYFRGAVHILRHVDSINFPLLYSGKITVEDQFRVQRIARLDCLKTPYFLRDINNYKRHLRNLLRVNGISKLRAFLTKEPELKLKLPKSSRANAKEDKFNNNNNHQQVKKSPRLLMIEARQRIMTSQVPGKSKLCNLQDETSSAETLLQNTVQESILPENPNCITMQHAENIETEIIQKPSFPDYNNNQNAKPAVETQRITARMPPYTPFFTPCRSGDSLFFSEEKGDKNPIIHSSTDHVEKPEFLGTFCFSNIEIKTSEIQDQKRITTEEFAPRNDVIIPSCALNVTTPFRSCVDRPKTPKPKMFKIKAKPVVRKVSPRPEVNSETIKLPLQRNTSLSSTDTNLPTQYASTLPTQYASTETLSAISLTSKKKAKKNFGMFFEELIPFVRSRKKRVLPLPLN